MKQTMLKKSLDRYVELSSAIRRLSSPDIKAIRTADDYRDTLLRNFTEIGKMTVEINGLLDDTIFPLMKSEDLLSDDQVEYLSSFSKSLVNTSTINYLDPMLSYKVANRLLADAERKNDDKLLIRALDKVIDSSYILMHFCLRMVPCSDLGFMYRERGLKASKRLLAYLDKEVFTSLPDDESKEIVLVNSRYINALECHCVKMSESEIKDMLGHLEDADQLGDDPYYVEAAPHYDWRRHRFRTYQYMISCTENNNACEISADDLNRIHLVHERLEELWHSDEEYYASLCPRSTMNLYAARMSYLTGHTDHEEYREELRRIHNDANPRAYDIHGIISNAFVLEEYLLAAREAGVSEKDNEFLRESYRNLAAYLHTMPKTGSISYAVSTISSILKNYINIPDYSFTDFSLRLINAIHPPTYVHTLTMSELTKYLSLALMQKKPELFVEFAGCDSPDEVVKHKEDILAYAEKSSLSHDIGKFFVIELIMMYGRRLFDEEFWMIKKHPVIGDYVLRHNSGANSFNALAAAHHFMFDELEQKAYEGVIGRADIPFIAAAICADGLDAATDTIGRSYKKGKSLETVISEFRDGSGTRYAPYIVDLFDDPEVVENVRTILDEDRSQNYCKAYETLMHPSKNS